MSDLEQLEELKKKQLAIAKEACEASEKYSSRLKVILEHLREIDEEINDHILNGDLTDHKRNSELWCERLANIEHQVQLFTQYTETSVDEFYKAAKNIIQFLQDLYPPK